MKAKTMKEIQMDIRNCLPEKWTYSQKLKALEELADEYRKKSRDEVYGDQKFKGKYK